MVQITPVFTDNDRIAQFVCIIPANSAHNVMPDNFTAFKFKTVMRLPAFSSKTGKVFRRIAESLPVINRRQTFCQQSFAFEFKFFRCIITSINPPGLFQLSNHFVITGKSCRLPRFLVPADTEPCQCISYAFFIFLL